VNLSEDRQLTPNERLRVGVAVLINGWDTHKVAALLGVEPERVAEAVASLKLSLENMSTDRVGARLAGLEAVARSVGGQSDG
jgi:hypothetical protein